GERDAAIACYERILPGIDGGTQEALRFEALARLTHLRSPSGLEDPLLGRLKEAAARTGLDDLTRANLLFSLGRAYDRLNLFDEAFGAFEQANRHGRSAGPAYDRLHAARQVDALIDAFGVPVEELPGNDPKLPEPVFICGMFR